MTLLSDKPVRKPFILNKKEEHILQAVHFLECVTVQEITRLLFATGSRNHVGAILRKLSGGRDYDDQEFLYRFPLPTAARGTKERVYCLGAKAREVLAIEDAPRASKLRYLSYSPILHDLMLSRFLTAATTYFAAHTDYDLLETRTCYQLARNPPLIEVNTHGKKATIAVIPDAWLYIERVEEGTAYPLWLEIDRGTENRQKFQQLVRNRLALVRSRQYKHLFHTQAVLLCYVSVGATPALAQTRLHHMLRWTDDVISEQPKKERQKWAALFRFTTVEFENMYEHTHTLLEEPVWYKPNVSDPVPLFSK